MKFIPVVQNLPSYGKRVIVRDKDNFYFTATFEIDENGDYWSYELPPGIIVAGGEVEQEIISWAEVEN